MTTKILTAAFLATGLAGGQPISLRVLKTTPRQIAIAYSAPSAAPCQIEASEEADYSPLAHDVNGTYFGSAQLDLSRSDTAVNGRTRIVVIGKATGLTYPTSAHTPGITVRLSRALRADAQHHVRVTCDGNAVALTASTSNYPLGVAVTNDLLPIHEDGFAYTHPSSSPKVQPSHIDPKTGTKLQAWTNEFGALGASVGAWSGSGGVAMDNVEDLGSFWSASSGTLADAIDADDNIYLQADAEDQWVFIGLGDLNGNKVPFNSTYSFGALMSQNFLLRVDCTGAGCGAGIEADVCFVQFDIDPTKCVATKTITATTSEAEVVVCHDAPCSFPNEPGDFIGPDIVKREELRLGNGRIWNEAGSFNTIRFLEQADCDRLRVNDRLRWYEATALRTQRVTAKDCGATPPQVTIDSTTAQADDNGTDGMAFYTDYGPLNNQRYGILIRKKNAVADATLRIDTAKWRTVFSTNAINAGAGFSPGSGGFNERCNRNLTPNGWRLCAGSYDFFAYKPNAAGDCPNQPLDGVCVKYIGSSRILGPTFATLVPNATSTIQILATVSEKFPWSTTEPDVFYVQYGMNQTSPATGTAGSGIARFKFAQPERACGEVGTTCAAVNPTSNPFPLPDFDEPETYSLTPCLSTCTAEAHDYTLAGQLKRAFPTQWAKYGARFGVGAITAITQNHILMRGREGNQNSLGWAFAFDIGNGETIGGGYQGGHGGPMAAQQVYSLFNFSEVTFGGDHANYVHGSAPFWAVETNGDLGYRVFVQTDLNACSRSGAGSCTPCATLLTGGTTVNGIDYAGKNWCTQISLTTSWDASWEPQPAEWRPGDPVRSGGCGVCNGNYHYLRELRIGDFLHHNVNPQEYLRVLQINSPTDIVVERGCHTDQTAQGPKDHASLGDFWLVFPNSQSYDCSNGRSGPSESNIGRVWEFTTDTNGANTHWTPYVNHSVMEGTLGFRPDYHGNYCAEPVTFACFTADIEEWRHHLPFIFAGVDGVGPGNSPQKHPNYHNFNAPGVQNDFFVDALPIVQLGSPADNVATRVTGDIWWLEFGSAFYFDPKHMPVAAFLAQAPFKNISGPGSVLPADATGRGKMCLPLVNDECFAGSIAGRVYVNGPLDETNDICRANVEAPNICWGNMTSFAATNSQWLAPSANDQRLRRNHFRPMSNRPVYKDVAVANVKMSNEGSWLWEDWHPMYAILPAWPGTDTVVRDTFVPLDVTINNKPAEAARFLVKFGYDENFHCSSNRAEVCYATGGAIDEANPFLWGTELTNGSGVDIGSGSSWTVRVPTLPGYVVYTQKVYRGGSGNVVATGPVELH